LGIALGPQFNFALAKCRYVLARFYPRTCHAPVLNQTMYGI
jgi:hypothetical protein